MRRLAGCWQLRSFSPRVVVLVLAHVHCVPPTDSEMRLRVRQTLRVKDVGYFRSLVRASFPIGTFLPQFLPRCR